MLIWKDADIAGAVNSLSDCFLGSTQICMVPKMALIHESIYGRFKEAFIDKIKTMKIGIPSDPETCLTPVGKISGFYEFLNDAIKKGAQLIYGGQRQNYKGEPDEHGFYLSPSILEIEASDNLEEFRCVKEENFFPLLPLVVITPHSKRERYRGDPNEAIFKIMLDILNANPYGLRISAWCSSDSLIRKLIREIHNCGMLRINCRHVDFSLYLATHGGRGKTGGPFGEMNYFWQKTTHLQGVNIHRLKESGELSR